MTKINAGASAARKYRRQIEVEAMLVTESAQQADAIRDWLGPYNWKPNTSVMRPGCVIVRVGPGLEDFDLAPPGYYVVRHADLRLSVVKADHFDRTFDYA